MTPTIYLLILLIVLNAYLIWQQVRSRILLEQMATKIDITLGILQRRGYSPAPKTAGDSRLIVWPGEHGIVGDPGWKWQRRQKVEGHTSFHPWVDDPRAEDRGYRYLHRDEFDFSVVRVSYDPAKAAQREEI